MHGIRIVRAVNAMDELLGTRAQPERWSPSRQLSSSAALRSVFLWRSRTLLAKSNGQRRYAPRVFGFIAKCRSASLRRLAVWSPIPLGNVSRSFDYSDGATRKPEVGRLQSAVAMSSLTILELAVEDLLLSKGWVVRPF